MTHKQDSPRKSTSRHVTITPLTMSDAEKSSARSQSTKGQDENCSGFPTIMEAGAFLYPAESSNITVQSEGRTEVFSDTQMLTQSGAHVPLLGK